MKQFRNASGDLVGAGVPTEEYNGSSWNKDALFTFSKGEKLTANLLVLVKKLAEETDKSPQEIMKNLDFSDDIERAKKLIQRKKEMRGNPLTDENSVVTIQEDETTIILEEYFNIPEELKKLL